jgi:hypothetical protein
MDGKASETGRLDQLARLHAQQLSRTAEALKHHPNQAAVDRLLRALTDSFAYARRLVLIEEGGMEFWTETSLPELEWLELMACNAQVRARAAADELEAEMKWQERMPLRAVG